MSIAMIKKWLGIGNTPKNGASPVNGPISIAPVSSKQFKEILSSIAGPIKDAVPVQNQIGVKQGLIQQHGLEVAITYDKSILGKGKQTGSKKGSDLQITTVEQAYSNTSKKTLTTKETITKVSGNNDDLFKNSDENQTVGVKSGKNKVSDVKLETSATTNTTQMMQPMLESTPKKTVFTHKSQLLSNTENSGKPVDIKKSNHSEIVSGGVNQLIANKKSVKNGVTVKPLSQTVNGVSKSKSEESAELFLQKNGKAEVATDKETLKTDLTHSVNTNLLDEQVPQPQSISEQKKVSAKDNHKTEINISKAESIVAPKQSYKATEKQATDEIKSLKTDKTEPSALFVDQSEVDKKTSSKSIIAPKISEQNVASVTEKSEKSDVQVSATSSVLQESTNLKKGALNNSEHQSVMGTTSLKSEQPVSTENGVVNNYASKNVNQLSGVEREVSKTVKTAKNLKPENLTSKKASSKPENSTLNKLETPITQVKGYSNVEKNSTSQTLRTSEFSTDTVAKTSSMSTERIQKDVVQAELKGSQGPNLEMNVKKQEVASSSTIQKGLIGSEEIVAKSTEPSTGTQSVNAEMPKAETVKAGIAVQGSEKSARPIKISETASAKPSETSTGTQSVNAEMPKAETVKAEIAVQGSEKSAEKVNVSSVESLKSVSTEPKTNLSVQHEIENNTPSSKSLELETETTVPVKTQANDSVKVEAPIQSEIKASVTETQRLKTDVEKPAMLSSEKVKVGGKESQITTNETKSPVSKTSFLKEQKLEPIADEVTTSKEGKTPVETKTKQFIKQDSISQVGQNIGSAEILTSAISEKEQKTNSFVPVEHARKNQDIQSTLDIRTAKVSETPIEVNQSVQNQTSTTPVSLSEKENPTPVFTHKLADAVQQRVQSSPEIQRTLYYGKSRRESSENFRTDKSKIRLFNEKQKVAVTDIQQSSKVQTNFAGTSEKSQPIIEPTLAKVFADSTANQQEKKGSDSATHTPEIVSELTSKNKKPIFSLKHERVQDEKSSSPVPSAKTEVAEKEAVVSPNLQQSSESTISEPILNSGEVIDWTPANSSENRMDTVLISTPYRKDFPVKMIQLVRNLPQQETQRGQELWHKTRFVTDEGEALNMAVRKTDGVLQLQINGGSPELTRIIQQHVQEIRENLQQKLDVRVEVQFTNPDQSGQGQQQSAQSDKGPGVGKLIGLGDLDSEQNASLEKTSNNKQVVEPALDGWTA